MWNYNSGICFLLLLLQLIWPKVFSIKKKKSDHDVKDVNDIHFWNNKYNHPEEYVMLHK